MSRIKLSLKELVQVLEIAVTTNVRGKRYVFDEDKSRSDSILARLEADGLFYDETVTPECNIVTPNGRAFYNSGGYAGQRRRRILRNIFVWLSTVLAAFLGSLLATLL